MKRGPLWKFSVVTTPEAEEAVTEALANLFGTMANAHTDLRTGRITVSVFSETKPDGRTSLVAQWQAVREQLKACGLVTGPARLRSEQIRRENWAESWKRHFKPLEIGHALLLKPSWIKRQPRQGQAVVVLDPGLSFGTGQHPTTAFCLRELVWRRVPDGRQSFLDIGTGSGLLAIAAAKLGYAPVHAFDFDPEAVRVARANAKANQVAEKLHITRGDLTKLPTKPARAYDMVGANLISTVLVAERKRIAARVKPGGTLVVAGILKPEFHLVETAFKSLGFQLIACKREREWASGAFRNAAT